MTIAPAQQPPPMSERRVALLGAMLTAIGPVSMALFTPAMPEVVHAFGTTEAAVKMTLSMYFAGFAFAQLVCGPLSDGLGRKPVTIAFMLIYLAGSALALFAPTVETLIGARFLQGVGSAAGIAISRAVVRDLFTHEQSARIMNLIGLILGIVPAFAPTVGGLTLELFGWHAIFVVMLLAGMAIIVVVRTQMTETVERDPRRIRLGALAASYRRLLSTPYFLLISLVMAGSTGAIYAQATILPFILMDRAGLSPSQFGFSMLMQSGSYFAGSLAMRVLIPRFGAYRLVPAGLVFMLIGSALLAVGLRLWEPGFLNVMGPVAIYVFGIAFCMPAVLTASMAPFPKNAGAASALGGFFQMGAGLLGGVAAALIGDPAVAMSSVIPAMGVIATVAWLAWRRLPEPRPS